MEKEIKILIVEDDSAVREGLKMLIGGTKGYNCVPLQSARIH
jgi:YesN/AraC family two-component response regulator